MKKKWFYNIHNIITIVSEGELPELETFMVNREISKPTIEVVIGNPKKANHNGGKSIFFQEILGILGFGVSIEYGDPISVVASPMLRYSPHVLYTNVIEPLLRWTFVTKDYALVHAATIAFGDRAYMITARTDTGKTTTLLKILSYQRRNNDQAAFLSDDMILISSDGVARNYPKPLTISFHTLRAVNANTLTFSERLKLPIQSRIHSKSGRKAAFIISKSPLPAATINLYAQLFVPPPKYFVNKLLPKVKMASKLKVSGLFIIERGSDGIFALDNKEAIEVLLENCEDAYGFPPYDDLKEFLYLQDNVDLREKEKEIIRQGLTGLPATSIRSENLGWWALIPTFIGNDQVSKDITRAYAMEHSDTLEIKDSAQNKVADIRSE